MEENWRSCGLWSQLVPSEFLSDCKVHIITAQEGCFRVTKKGKCFSDLYTLHLLFLVTNIVQGITDEGDLDPKRSYNLKRVKYPKWELHLYGTTIFYKILALFTIRIDTCDDKIKHKEKLYNTMYCNKVALSIGIIYENTMVIMNVSNSSSIKLDVIHVNKYTFKIKNNIKLIGFLFNLKQIVKNYRVQKCTNKDYKTIALMSNYIRYSSITLYLCCTIFHCFSDRNQLRPKNLIKPEIIKSCESPSTLIKNLKLGTISEIEEELDKEREEELFRDIDKEIDKEISCKNNKRNRSQITEEFGAKKPDLNNSFDKFQHHLSNKDKASSTFSESDQSTTSSETFNTTKMGSITLGIYHPKKPTEMLDGDFMSEFVKKLDMMFDEVTDEAIITGMEGTKIKNGHIEIQVSNEVTVTWVIKSIACLNEHSHIKVIAHTINNEPMIKCKVRIANRVIDEQMFFSKIKRSNPDIDISKWSFITSVPQNGDKILVIFRIDEPSLEVLKHLENPMMIKFGVYGKIKVILDSDQAQEPPAKKKLIGTKHVKL